jgi:ABC-type sugar transport system permease subunit
MSRQETRWAWLFLAPWVIGFLVFTGGPMIASLVLSFTEYDVISAPRFTGLDNYRQLMSDAAVAKSLGNTVFYTALHVPLAMAVSLGLALLQRVGRASGLFRTIFYLPVMTPAVAVGILFLFLLNGQQGLINGMLALVGIEGPNWTTDPAWIKPGIVLMSLWTLGSTTIIYLAALNNVPRDLYEAARIDGGRLLATVPPHHRADDLGGAVLHPDRQHDRLAPAVRRGLHDVLRQPGDPGVDHRRRPVLVPGHPGHHHHPGEVRRRFVYYEGD